MSELEDLAKRTLKIEAESRSFKRIFSGLNAGDYLSILALIAIIMFILGTHGDSAPNIFSSATTSGVE